MIPKEIKYNLHYEVNRAVGSLRFQNNSQRSVVDIEGQDKMYMIFDRLHS